MVTQLDGMGEKFKFIAIMFGSRCGYRMGEMNEIPLSGNVLWKWKIIPTSDIEY